MTAFREVVAYDPEPTPFFVRGSEIQMPWPDAIRQCVVFIGIRKNGRFQPRATAFIVQYRYNGFTFDNLVTAEHVVSMLVAQGHQLWLRINMKNGDVAEVKLASESFYYHPDEANRTDVAVCPMPPGGTASDTGEFVQFEYRSIGLNGPRAMVVSENVLKEKAVGIGDEVGVVGLFRSHFGEQRNVPILRTGHIAAMLGEPVWTKYAGFVEAYLIEAMSIGGLSGSPVFLYMHGRRYVGGAEMRHVAGDIFIFLLGLMHGHFDISNLNEDVVVDTEPQSSQGIHTGMGVVIPVHKIIETVEHPDLMKKRQDHLDGLRTKGAIPDMGDVGEVGRDPPATAENPQHREDFTSLLEKAARTPPQDD